MLHWRRGRREQQEKKSEKLTPKTFFDLRSTYTSAINILGIAPSEFWMMTPNEMNALFSAHVKMHKRSNSKLSEADQERLDARRAELEAKGVEVW